MKEGRPLKFKTVKELESKIEEYFDSCQDEIARDDDGNVITDKSGNAVWIPKPPTVSGLALALGFDDRRSIYDYKERPEFSHTIKNAIMRISDYAERHLYIGKATGAIFWLKNHGWRDTKEVEGTLEIKQALVEFSDEPSKSDDTNKV